MVVVCGPLEAARAAGSAMLAKVAHGAFQLQADMKAGTQGDSVTLGAFQTALGRSSHILLHRASDRTTVQPMHPPSPRARGPKNAATVRVLAAFNQHASGENTKWGSTLTRVHTYMHVRTSVSQAPRPRESLVRAIQYCNTRVHAYTTRVPSNIVQARDVNPR